MKTEKQEIDYIYICQKKGKWHKVTTLREMVAGISVLKLVVTVKRKARQLSAGEQKFLERLQRKLKKMIKKYQIEHCVVGADFAMAEKLQVAEVLFQARKLELLEHKKEIMMNNAVATTPVTGSSFLLVLDSEKWSGQEVLQLLLTAKDFYDDLNIVIKNNHINLREITTSLYDEWGIVLHALSEKAAKKSQMDCALFLLERWESKVYRYSVKSGYVVSENEGGMVRSRGQGKFHAGFVYECAGFELPYQMAVNIFYQNPKLYDKFAITFIDIYSV